MALGVYFTLLTLCAVFGTSVQQSRCPGGWSIFENTCYRHVREFITWDQAKTRCASQGAILAEPDSWDKHIFLSRLMRRFVASIGGTDRQSEGTWVWSGSRRPIDFHLWRSGQPDSRWGNEDCLQMSVTGWFDVKCSKRRPYICEKQANV